MTISKGKSVDFKNPNIKIKHLVQKFYDLRKTFIADYSGTLRSHKYEETREFTIALNHAIFQVNQLDLNDSNTTNVIHELSIKYEFIKQDYLLLTT